jgi:hypothetical protein
MFLAKGFLMPASNVQKNEKHCKEAFEFVMDEFGVVNQINLCKDVQDVPIHYESLVNMPVCDDTLCANVVLKIFWDLAGNYSGFDTISGYPLTKFDHIKFTTEDYQKLDQILKNRNSMLRILKKEDLIDKSVQVKSKTVDAVTGATPATIKKSVVEGAVYSSFTLWHFVNGAIKNQIANFTLDNYSDEVSRRMLLSENFETQLFALKLLSEEDFEKNAELIFQVISQSVPLVKANVLVKLPLPFTKITNNQQLLLMYSELDNYSKSIFLNRMLTEQKVAECFLPLALENQDIFSQKQNLQIKDACLKYNIVGRHD